MRGFVLNFATVCLSMYLLVLFVDGTCPSDTWETRHGAALGLREILKRHAKGAGITGSLVDPEKNFS